ncbi:cellulose biosynthesis protein BcsG, partial [Escherichia coli]|uniref:cellulose biosynthesis protein BcsG n=1 Tax=Escherichia coli TaxID=562 RepID=UPI00178C890E
QPATGETYPKSDLFNKATAPVSENSNAVVIQYQDKPYVRLNGGDWVPYPQ